MNASKTLRLAQRLAATVATAGLAAVAIGAPLPNFTGGPLTPTGIKPNLPGTPNDGMVCRAGYTASFNGTSLKCSKTSTIVVNLICPDPNFPTYVSRTVGSPGSDKGLDICLNKNGTVVVTSTSNIKPLVKGSDFEFAKADATKIAEKTAARDLEEAAAFGGTATDVETEAGEAEVNTATGDSKDNAKVTLTHFTFPIRTGGIIVVGP